MRPTHHEALSYLAWAATQVPRRGQAVEFGSYDVNGSARPLFPEAQWHGIDTRAGKNVDEVADVRDWDGLAQYDLVLCTEMLEHCEYPWEAVDSAWYALRPGGYFVATMAAPERAPHDGNGDPWTPDCGEHYEGIRPQDLADWLRDWRVLHLQHDESAGDLRCIAQKPE